MYIYNTMACSVQKVGVGDSYTPGTQTDGHSRSPQMSKYPYLLPEKDHPSTTGISEKNCSSPSEMKNSSPSRALDYPFSARPSKKDNPCSELSSKKSDLCSPEPSDNGDCSYNSRPMTEEDLIDSLFFTCDVDHVGKVHIHRLVEYLKLTTSNISENDKDLKNLATMLDPQGMDTFIDLHKYRSTMKHWIESIRKQSFLESEDDVFSSDVCSTGTSSLIVNAVSPDSTTMTTPNHSAETFSSVYQLEQMEGRVEGLQHQNRRLLEDNTKLQHQLDAQEDHLTAVSTEKDKLTRKIKSLQEIVDLKQVLQTENEELRCANSRLQERRKDLENKLNQLEREKSLCDSHNIDLEHKLQTISGQVECLSVQKQDLHISNVENKHKMSQLLEVKTMQEVQLNERFNEVKNLQNEIKVMSKTMEEIRQEKDSLKLQNSQVQQELSSVHAKMETFTFHDTSLVSEEGTPKLYSCSTPLKASQSICMELKEMAMRDSGKLLPMPLCAKEYFEEVFADITPLLDHKFEEKEEEEEEEESLSEDMSASSKDDLTMEISKFADKYTEKQTKLLQEIDSYIQVEGQHKDTHMAEEFHRNLKSELDKMLQRVSTLAKAKELADNRLIGLKMKLMKVSDENHQLKVAHQKSYELITEKGLDMELSVDNRLQVLKDTVDRERSYIRMLEKELAEKNPDANVAGHNDKCNTLGPSTEDLLQEIDRLKRENLDLEGKCHKTEIKVQDLEDALGRSQEELDVRNTQCDQLEENLSTCKLDRQLDLKEIWRLVHKDVEKECSDDQKEVPLSDTPYHIRNQITQEIQNLKSQLHKREAVLDILTSSKSKPEHQSLERSTCSCFGNLSGSNASSPLVEALTIDFFNGNQPLHRVRKGPDIASSEMDLLSGCSKCQEQMYNGWGYSNTSLGNRCPPQHQTSTESNNNTSQTNLCKSVSSSSTSGAADLDLSTSTLKSCDGRTRRKEFQTIRWESDDIVYQSSSSSFDKEHGHTEGPLEGNRTLDHNDNTTCGDMLTPAANGLRRWSFNAAIANQNYASDDMVHYPRCRSQSFQAAIESGQQTPGDYKDNVGDGSRLSYNGNKYTKRNICFCGDNTGSCAKCNARKGFSAPETLRQGGGPDVSKHNGVFNLSKPSVLGNKYGVQTQSSEESEDSTHTGPVDDYCWNDNMDQNSYSSYSFSHISYPTEYREPANDSRSSPHLTRKLSILIEEDDTPSEAEVPRSPQHGRCGLTSGQLRDGPQHGHKRTDLTQCSERGKTKRVCVPEGGHCGNPTKVHPTVAVVHHSSPAPESASKQRVRLVTPEKEVSWQDKEKARDQTTPLEDCRQGLPHSSVEPLLRATPTQTLTHRAPPQYPHQGVSPQQQDRRRDGGVTGEGEHDLSITSDLALHLGKLSLSDSMSSESSKPSRSPQQQLQSSSQFPTSSQSVNLKAAPLKHGQADHQVTMPGIKADHTAVKTDRKTAVSPAKTDLNPSMTKASPVNFQTNTDQAMKDQNSSDSEDLAKSCKLAKIRQDHLNKKREQMKHVKMPELMETQEVGSLNGTKRPETNGGVLQPPPPSNQPAFPSIPNSFLHSLKLNSDTVNGDDDGSEQANEQEIEKKFTSLSLAFKTDKLTLEKRLEIQERSRDIAEQNVDTELKGLKDNLETLNQLCTDTQVRDILRKIQTHLDILEQAAARVSSRAEVFGAVQQEKRMSKAIEIMITHVDTIRMVHERVNSELEEARKLLQDSRPFGSTGLEIGDFPHMSKRSLSLSQQGQGFQSRVKGRRVSEVAIPRALGGTGVPSFTHSTSMDASMSLECKQPTWPRKDSPDTEDAKSRFQCAVASMAMKNAVTDTFRRGSLTMGKQASVSGTPPKSRENSTESKEVPDKTLNKQNSKEEEAFQKGFQQGYKAQMGRELSSLREHQNSINQNLEELMDTYDSPPEEEERTFKEVVMEKIWDMVPEWEIAGKRLRMTLAGLVFFMALCSIIMSFLPLSQAMPDYRHMDHPPL